MTFDFWVCRGGAKVVERHRGACHRTSRCLSRPAFCRFVTKIAGAGLGIHRKLGHWRKGGWFSRITGTASRIARDFWRIEYKRWRIDRLFSRIGPLARDTNPCFPCYFLKFSSPCKSKWTNFALFTQFLTIQPPIADKSSVLLQFLPIRTPPMNTSPVLSHDSGARWCLLSGKWPLAHKKWLFAQRRARPAHSGHFFAHRTGPAAHRQPFLAHKAYHGDLPALLSDHFSPFA